MRRCFLLTLFALAACRVDPPRADDAGPPDAVTDAADPITDAPPPPPPGTAMETVTGGGRATSATMVIDIQLGGLPGPTATPATAVRPAPALP